MGESAELSGWKAIAGHLRVSVRTAQEYEKQRGLPIQHDSGAKGRVFADAAALDAWRVRARRNGGGEAIEAEPGQRPVLRRAGWIVAIATLAGATGWLGYRLLAPVRQPAEIRVEPRTLIVNDTEGREIWRYEFPKLLWKPGYNGPALENHRLLADLDGRGRNSVLFACFTIDSGERPTNVLYCFSPSGKVRWQFTPGRSVSTPTEHYSPPFMINNVRVIPASGRVKPKIALSSNHYMSYPNQVAILDGDGKLVGEYWHAGHLLSMAEADLNRDGKPMLLLGGVDSGVHQAVLIVFDPDAFPERALNRRGRRAGATSFSVSSRGARELSFIFRELTWARARFITGYTIYRLWIGNTL